jgi:hypothetical protein
MNLFLDPLPPDLLYVLPWRWWWILYVASIPPDKFFGGSAFVLAHSILSTLPVIFPLISAVRCFGWTDADGSFDTCLPVGEAGLNLHFTV